MVQGFFYTQEVNMLKKIVPILFVSLLLASCSTAVQSTPGAKTLADGTGKQISILAAPSRIISVAPSNTEILYALNAGGLLVGRDEFSDYPVEAKQLPSVGGVEKFNMEQIINLKPDLVLAASITPAEQVAAIEALKIPVFVVANPKDLAGLNDNILLVGKLVSKDTEAALLVKTLTEKAERVKKAISTTASRPKVFYELDGTDPAKPWTAGKTTFIDQLVEAAGGTNVGNIIQGEWGQISLEQLVVENPDIIILGDLVYGITPEEVIARPAWDKLKGVKDKKIFGFDDNLASRPGPRMVDGMVEFARIIHPEIAEQLK
jgi:iron complex transport system substrate-binding protein